MESNFDPWIKCSQHIPKWNFNIHWTIDLVISAPSPTKAKRSKIFIDSYFPWKRVLFPSIYSPAIKNPFPLTLEAIKLSFQNLREYRGWWWTVLIKFSICDRVNYVYEVLIWLTVSEYIFASYEIIRRRQSAVYFYQMFWFIMRVALLYCFYYCARTL